MRLLDENELVAVGELEPVLLVTVLDDHFAAAGKQILAGNRRCTRRLAGCVRPRVCPQLSQMMVEAR